jgi:hypothetical protein
LLYYFIFFEINLSNTFNILLPRVREQLKL